MVWASLSRKSFWDRVEIAAALLVSLFAAIAANTADHKAPWLMLSFFSAVAVGGGKWRAKQLEEAEKRSKVVEEARAAEERALQLAELRERYANQARRMMRAVLEDFHGKYFKGVADAETYMNRTTLFVCAECAGADGPGKRLEIFARAGRHQESDRIWPVDDDEPELCRGVAGQIWYHGTTRVWTAECDWPNDEDDVLKARYANSLGITVPEAEQLRVKSRSFTGTRIMVTDKKWGVLLLDSLNPSMIRSSRYGVRLLNEYSTFIGEIVRRMEE